MRVGDVVKWSSQAAGTMKTKQGEIVEVVPPNEHPKMLLRGFSALSRKHESYVVHVGSGTGMRNYYRPVVSGLELVTASSETESPEQPHAVVSETASSFAGGGAA